MSLPFVFMDEQKVGLYRAEILVVQRFTPSQNIQCTVDTVYFLRKL